MKHATLGWQDFIMQQVKNLSEMNELRKTCWAETWLDQFPVQFFLVWRFSVEIGCLLSYHLYNRRQRLSLKRSSLGHSSNVTSNF